MFSSIHFLFKHCSCCRVLFTYSIIVQVFEYSILIEGLFIFSSIHYLLKQCSRFGVFFIDLNIVHVFEFSLLIEALFTFSSIHYLFNHRKIQHKKIFKENQSHKVFVRILDIQIGNVCGIRETYCEAFEKVDMATYLSWIY